MPEKVKAVTFFKRTSYKDLFPQIPTLAEMDYFLQFNGYEIFLPQRLRAQEVLNIFELSVLRFKEIGNFSEEELADKLCLEKDFVKFILIRLTELELLDNTRQITDLGRKFLGEKISATTENIVPYLLLVSRDTGEIFPSFFPRQNQPEAELDKPYVKIFLGSAGKSTTVKGRCIFVKEKGKRPQNLPQKQIRDALTKFNRKTDDKIFVESAAHIQSTYTQPVYLHVKAVLQDGNVDYAVVSDGQIFHSDFLRDCLESQNPGLLIKLKESATKISENISEKVAPEAGKKYFEIRRAMQWENVAATNVDEIERVGEKQKRQLENLAKAVEWALRYHLLKFPPPRQLMNALSAQTPEENFETLTGFAEQLGLNDALKFPNFFTGISSALIRNCLSTDNPTIVPLLAVNIATAVRVADSNLLNALNVLPNDDAFGFLQRLDNYGKKLRHENKWAPQKNDTLNFLRQNVLKFIQALLPDYENPAAVVADLSNTSQKKLNAQLSIMRALGEEIFQNLPKKVQTLMLKISPDKVGGQMPAPIEFVTTLAMILENIFLCKLKEFPEKILLSKSDVIARLTEAGASTNLETVSEKFYLQACQKKSSTLGAYALAYMAILTDKQFKKFIAANLHEFIFDVTTLRGHANNLSLVLEKEKLCDLRDKVFTAVKILEVEEFGTNEN